MRPNPGKVWQKVRGGQPRGCREIAAKLVEIGQHSVEIGQGRPIPGQSRPKLGRPPQSWTMPCKLSLIYGATSPQSWHPSRPSSACKLCGQNSTEPARTWIREFSARWPSSIRLCEIGGGGLHSEGHRPASPEVARASLRNHDRPMRQKRELHDHFLDWHWRHMLSTPPATNT